MFLDEHLATVDGKNGEKVRVHKYTQEEKEPLKTDDMPISPIDPSNFITKITPYLEKYKQTIYHEHSRH